MLKSANLLHKCGLGDSDMNSTVEDSIRRIGVTDWRTLEDFGNVCLNLQKVH